MDFRKTVVVLIVNSDGEFLSVFCTRNNAVVGIKKDQNIWKLPQGGIDEGESVIDACKREIKEELGIDINVNQIVQKKDWCEEFSYHFLNEEGIPCFEVRLYPVLIIVENGLLIDLDKEENGDFEWVVGNDFLERDLGIRKDAYENVLKMFNLV